MMQSLYRTLFSVFLMLGPVGMCLAQAATDEPEPKSYVASYFVVGLGITLGLVAICKGAGRRKEVRRPE